MNLAPLFVEVVVPLVGLALLEGVARLLGPPLSRALAPRHGLIALGLSPRGEAFGDSALPGQEER